MIKPISIFSFFCLVIACTSLYSSDDKQAFEAIAPKGVSITSVRKADEDTEVSGVAENNALVSQLMRAIQESNMGNPALKRLTRKSDRERLFELIIH